MQRTDENQRGNGSPLNRRQVLKAAGATTVGGAVFAGTASGHEITEAVFCGCSQACACGDGKVRVWVAEETSEGYSCDYVWIDRDSETPFSFCYEVDEGKVIAVEDGDGTVVCNPNDSCAGDALAGCGISCDRYGQSGGPCGEAFLRTCGEQNSSPGRGR